MPDPPGMACDDVISTGWTVTGLVPPAHDTTKGLVMAERAKSFLEVLQPVAPDLVDLAKRTAAEVTASDVLDRRVRSLIIFALDIAAGSDAGAAGVARQCRAI